MAFQDQADREAWSGRPPLRWTYAAADAVVSRLAAGLRRLDLPPRSPVAICLPGGSEACLSILAVERSGLVPCLVPVAWPEHEIAEALDAVDPNAVISQGRVADARPAEMFRHLARARMGVRFVAAFGPAVPDGVIDLDGWMLDADLERGPGLEQRYATAGVVTFHGPGGARSALLRPTPALVAAARSAMAAGPLSTGDHILTLLAPDDLGALATGLVPSLLSGAALETHGLFSASAFVGALRDAPPSRVVAPGWMEATLAAAGPGGALPPVTLVHRPPARFRARGALGGEVGDVLALGELAIVAGRRGRDGRIGLSLGGGVGGPATGEPPLRLRRSDGGALSIGGPASETRPFPAGEPRPGSWVETGYACETFSGYLTEVSAS